MHPSLYQAASQTHIDDLMRLADTHRDVRPVRRRWIALGSVRRHAPVTSS
jgi:hypothetical protein